METGGRQGEYITLSHCWGTPESQTKTTKKLLEQYELDIPEKSLGQTYKDAVTVTRAFNISYLWIDSLCIVQGDTAEWEAESAKMASIYENSYLTICATHAKDGHGGLFSDRQLTTKRAVPFALGTLANNPPITVYGRWEFEHHRGNKGGNEYSARTTEPLNRRGWAFQERLLSRRTIDFLSAEIVWQCNRIQRCEYTQIDRMDQTLSDTDSTMFFKTALSLPDIKLSENRPPDDLLFGTSTWENIVTAYTSLQLTFPHDKLPALSGLAQRMARIEAPKARRRSVYLAGLWAYDLPRQLLW
jgi:hypothetical protein